MSRASSQGCSKNPKRSSVRRSEVPELNFSPAGAMPTGVTQASGYVFSLTASSQQVAVNSGPDPQPPTVDVLSSHSSVKIFSGAAPVEIISLGKSNQYPGDEFQQLVEEWRMQRGVSSSITEGVLCSAYQGIIGMGTAAVPLLLRQLEAEGNDPDQWFWALRAITRCQPVPEEDFGNFSKMAQSWLKWGRQSGYVW